MFPVHYQKINGRSKINPQIAQIRLNLCICGFEGLKLFVAAVRLTQSKISQLTERGHAAARL